MELCSEKELVTWKSWHMWRFHAKHDIALLDIKFSFAIDRINELTWWFAAFLIWRLTLQVLWQQNIYGRAGSKAKSTNAHQSVKHLLPKFKSCRLACAVQMSGCQSLFEQCCSLPCDKLVALDGGVACGVSGETAESRFAKAIVSGCFDDCHLFHVMCPFCDFLQIEDPATVSFWISTKPFKEPLHVCSSQFEC